MRLAVDVLLDYALAAPADVLLQIEAARMADQQLVSATLTVGSPEPLRAEPGEESIGQRTWARGAGRLDARYVATIDIVRPAVALDRLVAGAPRDLPGLVSPYLLPSRYVESDRFEAFVARQFGHVGGGAKVLAMRDWLNREMTYVSGASDGTTTAADSFVRREGVCRDYAHLMAAFARAALIPARLVSVYAPGVTPPDFHAVVEVWLEGIVAFDRRDRHGGSGRDGADRGRARRHRHRVHDDLRQRGADRAARRRDRGDGTGFVRHGLTHRRDAVDHRPRRME